MFRNLHITDLTWSLLRAIVTWSIVVAGTVAVASCFTVRDPRFTATFLIAATFDIVTLAYILKSARRFLEGDMSSTAQMVSLLSTRMFAKGVLLVVAVLLPDYLDFLGMVLGVLLVDTTILVVGSTAAAVRMLSYRHPESSRRG